LNLFIGVFSKTSSTIFAILFLGKPFGVVTVNAFFIPFTPSLTFSLGSLGSLGSIVLHDIELYFIIRSLLLVHDLSTTCSPLVDDSCASL